MVPEPVREVCHTFLDAIDAERPGLVTGLYLVGSVALHDWRPHESDVDFVAVLCRAPGRQDVDALARAHRRLPRGRGFEGIHLTAADLRADPAACPEILVVHDGRIHWGRAEPVTWHVLCHHSVAVRGPPEPTVHADPAVLRAWTLGNLESYWRPWQQGRGRWLTLSVRGCSWGVLGVGRLHYTLATGEVTSKHGVGLYALATFPVRWHPVIRECLASREGRARLDRSPLARRRDALAFVETVIDDALARFRPIQVGTSAVGTANTPVGNPDTPARGDPS